MNWDDIRIFLAVARQGSVRNAAAALKVNHSTVSRRISTFEEKMNVRLFERLPNGYLLTTAGEELLRTANKIEGEIANVDRLIVGKDERMSGKIRVTLPSALGTSFLFEKFAEFCELYPEISLDINCSYEVADLNKREADLAIRVTKNPPENLIGRNVVTAALSTYISKELWEKTQSEETPTLPPCLAESKSMIHEEHFRNNICSKTPIKHYINNLDSLFNAVKAGMGIALLPCLMCDKDPELMRFPPGKTKFIHDIWVLIHKDLRHTLRIKTFKDFTIKALLENKDLIEGKFNQEQ